MASNIIFKTGNMFETEQPAFGHGVNTQGFMGSGIAKIIKHDYPEVFPPYKKACDEGRLVGGSMLPVTLTDGTIILNLASQEKTGSNATYEMLRRSVHNTFRYAEATGLTGFALPRIGAGIGGLEWSKVVQVITEEASKYPDITVELWSLPDAD